MAKRTKKFSFFGQNGIGGGLSSENPIIVDQNKLVVADNVLVSTSVARKKRGGTVKWHTGSFDQTASFPASGTPIRGIIEYWRTASLAGNPVADVFLHQGSAVWSIDDRNTVAVNRTGSLVLDSDAVPSYQPFNQKLYFCSTKTSDGYNVWDGTSATAVSATTPLDGPGKYLCSHLGRMIMAGNDDFPFRVYLSSALNPEDWTSIAPSDSTSLDLDDDGDPEGITAIASFQSRLYVWTRRATYEITGDQPDNFIVQKISNGIGCISHASVVAVPNDIIFASDRGVHSLRQLDSGRQTETTFLSRDIQRLWVDLINPSFFHRICATYEEPTNCYVISVPSSGQTENDSVLTYNIEFGTWTVWRDQKARSIATTYLQNKKNILAGREDGIISLCNQQSNKTDFDAGYTFNFKTGVLYLGDLTTERLFKNITVFCSTTQPTTFTVSWDIDGKKTGSKNITLDSGEDLLGTTFVLGMSKLGIGQYLPKTISIDDIGYGIQIEITASGMSDLEFYGFIIEAEEVNENYA